MTVRTFDSDARLAATMSLPIPRGIALRYAPPEGGPPSVAAVQALIVPHLPGWTVQDVPELAGWYELTPPPADAPMPLGTFWDTLRDLRSLPGVEDVDPLFLVANPQPEGEVATEAFALGFGQEQFGLWGLPYDAETAQKMRDVGRTSDWHLKQLQVDAAWTRWRERHPDKLPGDGIVVGHPDTGFSDHFELVDRFITPGHSFLEDSSGNPETSARDHLTTGFLENPGHGTATASVIASGEHDTTGAWNEAYGVAPGARVLPLRVSRSVIHFDFKNVARAILHAVDQRADVISMSLGGPGYSRFLGECIRYAQDQGVIIISAAGNNVPTVVFPAAFPEVIAVAATHAAKGPWRFSGVGELVDIAAPGEEVWCARASLNGVAPDFSVNQGTGTSFATACIAGLAALWLSYHGGRQTIADDNYQGRLDLVPFAFQYLLADTADKSLAFVPDGQHGAGIADADTLLGATLPAFADVVRFKQIIQAQPVDVFAAVSGLFSGLFGVADLAAATLTVDATAGLNGQSKTDAPEQTVVVQRAASRQQAARSLLQQLLGDQTEKLAPELLTRIAADRLLLVGFQRWRNGQSLLPFLDRLLAPPAAGAVGMQPGPALSADLAQALRERREREIRRLEALHRGKLVPGIVLNVPQQAGGEAARVSGWPPEATPPGSRSPEPSLPGPPPPGSRRLRAYAFDPSLATKLATARIHQVTIPTPWEHVLPGPIGEYLEVVDVDPSSGCAYSPVDLNHPHVLGQDGLPPSEGDPQFHQQMVYAVAMNTIHRFEMALGRPIFWSPLRPWLSERSEEQSQFTPESLEELGVKPSDRSLPTEITTRDRYVQRLRIYPHALREANAFYSPRKRALLFGYFPGSDDDTGRHYPGGMVFTCLSHDIVAHETTHALLDGMHPYFNEPSNIDVWAFHEAFADIMALFQHFTYPEVLEHQIANTRGDLETNNLLAQLAQQFGEATGQRGSLRDALGKEENGVWKRRTANARALYGVTEPHQRGSILIAAVFDAFLSLYNDRVADLLRIYTGGTGIVPAGRIHPDLVTRLAREAAGAAEEVLQICIRAMDYVPPVDVTFGEFLRALITADYDLSPSSRRGIRIAFIDAFRSWGIYPRDVTTLSEDSLRWRGPGRGWLTNLTQIGTFQDNYQNTMERLVPALEDWQPGSDRAGVFLHIQEGQRILHRLLADMQQNAPSDTSVIPGLDLRKGARFSVGNLRPARRIGMRGEFRTEMVVEVVQTYRPPAGTPNDGGPFRGGATLVVDLRSWEVRYSIYKRLWEECPRVPGEQGILAARFNRNQGQRGAADVHAAWSGEEADSLSGWLAATYACQERLANRRKRSTQEEPFALLHRGDL